MNEKQKIVFIDSDINVDYINNHLGKGQSISSVWTILNNQVTLSTTSAPDTLSHATLCTKMFLKHTTCACELTFINIWEGDELNANINSLVIALSWCLENDVTLINLSLGTTRIGDAPELFSIINKLVEKNIIIVAASSNAMKLTFPASFDHVFGVKALESKSGEVGFVYKVASIDLLEISCYIKDETIAYKDHHYFLCAANSLATPIISAIICNLINKGYNSIEQIKIKLIENSLHIIYNQDDKIYKKYFVQEIGIPIIAIASNHCSEISSIIQKLLSKFSKQGYHGVCLSVNDSTDLSKKTIRLMGLTHHSAMEKLHFYSHYCNVDYVIVNSSKEFLIRDLKTIEFDIILNYSLSDHFSEMEEILSEEILSILFTKHTDLDILFYQIYSHLAE